MNTSNPVVQQAASVTAIIVVIKATITYIRSMGWWNLEEQQYIDTVSFIETVLPIVIVWVGAFWAMRKTTSLENPKDIDGTPLTRPDNAPAIPKMEKLQEEAIKINKNIEERRIDR